MSLFDRFRGQDDAQKDVEKLPIWPTITSVAEVLSGEITDADAIERFNLDAPEQNEFAQIKNKVISDIDGIVSSLMDVGLSPELATSIAKSVVRNSVTQTLMRTELGYDTREAFNTSLGIS